MKNLLQIYQEAFKDSFRRSISENNQRIEFLDLAKGIFIILVVIYHSSIPILDSFTIHQLMPMFYVISGLLFSDYGSFFEHSRKKTNRILIPAIAFYIICYTVYSLWHHLGLSDTEITGHFYDIFFNSSQYNVALWFLFSLFFCNILFCLMSIVCKQNVIYIGIMCCFSGFIGYVLSTSGLRLFLYADSSLSAMPLFYFGWLLSKTNILYHSKKDKLYALIALAVLAAVIYAYYKIDNSNISFWANSFRGNPLILYTYGCLATLSTLLILKTINWLPIVSYIGRYSLIVLCSHILIIIVALKLIGQENAIPYIACILVLCWLAIPIFKEYLPYISGCKDSIKKKVKISYLIK